MPNNLYSNLLNEAERIKTQIYINIFNLLKTCQIMESIETILEIKDNTFARQFETLIPEGLVSVEYSFQEKKIFLTKINTPEGFENQALIDALLKSIMEIVVEKKFKLMPIHPKIVLFIKKNPKYKELLPPGIRI